MTTLLASGFGPDGGGLFQLAGDGFRRIDALETVGLAVAPGGSRLARALVGYLDGSAPAELLLYDVEGLVWRKQFADIHDVHGLAWTSDDEFAVASTSTNAIHRVGADGAPRNQQRFAEAVDAWHLNCPAVDGNGRLVATAFAQVDEEQGWRPLLRSGVATGVVVDVETGLARFGGLRGPHDPLQLPGGGWLVNDSASGALLELDPDGAPLRRADLGGWTRGLAIGRGGDEAYVGLSTRRHEGESGQAAVVRVDLGSFTPSERWPLACDEVFSLVWVEDALLSGVTCGFGARPGITPRT